MKVKELMLKDIRSVAILGTWIVGSIEDGPEGYKDHVLDMQAIIAALRRAEYNV